MILEALAFDFANLLEKMGALAKSFCNLLNEEQGMILRGKAFLINLPLKP